MESTLPTLGIPEAATAGTVRALSGCRHWMGGCGGRVAERTLE